MALIGGNTVIRYSYFKLCYKMVAIYLSKQQTLDADPKAIQKINFTENLNRTENTKNFFITEEVNETILDFHTEPWECCIFFTLI